MRHANLKLNVIVILIKYNFGFPLDLQVEYVIKQYLHQNDLHKNTFSMLLINNEHYPSSPVLTTFSAFFHCSEHV